MADSDSFVVPKNGPEAELKIKGSKFLGQTFLVRDAQAAAETVAGVQKKYRDASHHCWAYRLHPDERRTRCDDDGEPSGSAGRPILQAIEGSGFDNVLVVVTRYFGGTKLGTGGLVRAYGEAASTALDQTPRSLCWRRVTLRAVYDFNDLGSLEGVLARHGKALLDVEREYEPRPSLVLTIKASRAAAVEADLVESTGGRTECFVEANSPQ